jgi:hypothetical protein
MTPSRTFTPLRRASVATLVGATLAVMTGGCTIASVTTVGADADITRTVLARDLVRELQIDQVGSGPVTWAQGPGDLGPASPMQIVDRMLEPTEGVVEVLHRDKDTDDLAEVAVRPAWTTRLDNRSSSTPMTSSIADEVTISYVQPGSPGQHGEGDDHPKVDIDVTIEVAAGECSDVVALQVWQLDDPEVSGNGATVDATYLGSEVVTMACPA